jgi:hypothetical protein
VLSRAIYKKQRGRRWLTALATVALVTGTFVIASSALAFSQSNWELDKNATHNLTTSHLGALKGSITSSATSFTVCVLTNPLRDIKGNLVTSGTIQIDAEQMTLNSVSGFSTSTGGCSFSNPADVPVGTQTFNVTRPAGAAAHVGTTPRNDVTLIDTTATTTQHDWDQVYNAPISSGARDCSSIGATACIFRTRPNTGTASSSNGFTGPTTFTGTSGDTQNISQWTWTNQSVPDADEINNAYAAKYAGTPSDLYLGMDRYAVNGSKDIGFWFFHQAVTPLDGGGFSGAHCVAHQTTNGCPGAPSGDLLILTTFSAGGGTTTARAYEWVGSGGSDGALNFLGSFGDCVPGNPTDNGCATTANSTVNAPWSGLVSEKPTGASPGIFYAGGFMEAGLNLTALGETGCFASFLGTSRSSPSLTAQPKAFVSGGFENCTAGLVTTPSAGKKGSVAIGSNGTVSVTDSAALNVGGASSWSGTLRFFLCGPIAANNSSQTCDGTTNVGTQVGSDRTVTNADTQPFVSDSASISAAGFYCWRSTFTSSPPIPDAHDSSADECFTVTPLTPSIGTQVRNTNGTPADLTDDTDVSAPIPTGTTIYDTASLSGGTSNAGGTVSYRIYSDACTTLLGGTAGNAFNTQTDKTVTNGVAAKSDNITLSSPGTYYFQATYNDDANNVGGAKSVCSSEAVVVQSNPAPQSTPMVQIKDSVTVTGFSTSPAATGDVHVGLYSDSGCTAANQIGIDETFAIGGTQPFVTTFVAAPAADYYYKVSYAGDTYNTSFSSCAEHVGVTITTLP